MNKFFFWLYVFLSWFSIFAIFSGSVAFGSEENIISKEKKQILEQEKLQVQDTFPRYRTRFSHKAVQEEVYKKFLKKLKEKEQSK